MACFAKLLGRIDFENLMVVNQAELAKELGMHRQHVQRSIKRLIALGVILKARRSALAAPTGSTLSSVEGQCTKPRDRTRPGAQEANGECWDQGRDRGRPASPAGSPRARPGHAGHVHRVNPREAPTGCLRSNPRSEARAHFTQTSFVVLRSKARIHKGASLRFAWSVPLHLKQAQAPPPKPPNLRSKNQKSQ